MGKVNVVIDFCLLVVEVVIIDCDVVFNGIVWDVK